MNTSRYWRCPKCKAVLVKGIPPEVASLFAEMIGTGTCTNCGAQYSQQDIYSGKYDTFNTTASQDGYSSNKGRLTWIIVLFILIAVYIILITQLSS